MDPLSITVSCVALVETIGRASVAIRTFIVECREAAGDLLSIDRELVELRSVLDSIRDNPALTNENREGIVPHELRQRVQSTIENCLDVASKIETVIQRQSEARFRGVSWAMGGKKEVQGLKATLGAHRSALHLAINAVSLIVAKETKADTSAILDNTEDIADKMTRVMQEIADLKTMLSRSDAPLPSSMGPIYRLFENVAESVCDDNHVSDWLDSLSIVDPPGIQTDPWTSEYSEDQTVFSSHADGGDAPITVTEVPQKEPSRMPRTTKTPSATALQRKPLPQRTGNQERTSLREQLPNPMAGPLRSPSRRRNFTSESPRKPPTFTDAGGEKSIEYDGGRMVRIGSAAVTPGQNYAISSDGSKAVTWHGSIAYIHDLCLPGKVLKEFQLPKKGLLSLRPDWKEARFVTANGGLLFAKHKTWALYDWKTGEILSSISDSEFYRFKDSYAVSESEGLIMLTEGLSGCIVLRVRIADANYHKSCAIDRLVLEDSKRTYKFSFSNTGRTVIGINIKIEEEIRYWDIGSGGSGDKIPCRTQRVAVPALAAAGGSETHLLKASYNEVGLDGGILTGMLRNHDSQARVSIYKLARWNLLTGELLGVYSLGKWGFGHRLAIKLSRDGSFIRFILESSRNSPGPPPAPKTAPYTTTINFYGEPEKRTKVVSPKGLDNVVRAVMELGFAVATVPALDVVEFPGLGEHKRGWGFTDYFANTDDFKCLVLDEQMNSHYRAKEQKGKGFVTQGGRSIWKLAEPGPGS